MKKIFELLICFALLFSGCYFHNTLVFPAPEGFHAVTDSPFLSSSQTITGMANNGVLAVAVSRGGMIAWSSDSGILWTEVEPVNIADNFIDGIRFNAVTWGEGYFLAVGDEGRAAYSGDGIHWQAGVIGPMNPKNILCVAVGKIMGRTVFAAAGVDGRLAHATDSPAGPWYMADQSPFGSVEYYGEDIHALVCGEVKGTGVFVAAGDSGKIAVLKDLSGKWYGGRAGTHEIFRSLAYGNERFMAVGDNGIIKYAIDPLSYTWHTVKGSVFGLRPLRGAAFDPLINHFVLYTDDMIVGFSEFGDSWNAANFQGRFIPDEQISAISCTASRIILGGTQGTIVYSN